MLNQISMLFGGRIAEEVFMNQMTTGASNDFERATKIARDMVTRYGMTDRWAPWSTPRTRARSSWAAAVTKTTNMSESTHAEGGQRSAPHHRRAVPGAQLIEDNRTRSHAMAKALLNGKPSTASRSRTSWPGK
jgi:cell division protease FtsH